MAKTKKATQNQNQSPNQSQNKLYYFAHTFHTHTKTYTAGVGYELTNEQIVDYIKHVEIGTCPKISHTKNCNCDK